MSEISVRFVARAADCPLDLWSHFPDSLEGRWWYDALEGAALGDQFHFFYAVIEQAGRAVGLAPCFVMDVPIDLVVPKEVLPLFTIPGKLIPKLLYQRTLFVGSPCADEGTVVVLPGIDRQAAYGALQAALTAEGKRISAPMLVWKDFPAEQDADLQALADQAGLFAMPSFPGTVAVLPSASKDDYFASLKGSRRHQLKKKLRQSAQRVATVNEVIQNPSPQVMDEIFGLFWQTYERSETKFEKLNRRFFDLLAADPRSYFVMVRQADGGDLIAFMLCFRLGQGRIINKFIGIDYARPREWLLYFRLWEATVDWALSIGAAEIQSGQTGYAPKIEMGHSLIPLTNWCRHSNRVVHWVYGKVAGTITWATLDEALARYLAAHPDEAVSPRG